MRQLLLEYCQIRGVGNVAVFTGSRLRVAASRRNASARSRKDSPSVALNVSTELTPACCMSSSARLRLAALDNLLGPFTGQTRTYVCFRSSPTSCRNRTTYQLRI